MTTEYLLIEEWSHDEFAFAVNEAMKSGWRCQGGISICVTESHDRNENEDFSYTYAQAMVRP
jgi:hypothetical protein